MIPRLTTAQSGPLKDLELRMLDRMPEVERWLRTRWQADDVFLPASKHDLPLALAASG